MSVKIAMAQIICIDNDRNGNFARIEMAIKEAKEKQADIILFPESCLLGWINPEAHNTAFPIPGKDSIQLCEFAKKYKIHICIGLDEKENEKLFGSAILIDDEGEILLKHRKINVLPELMTPPYSIGKTINIVKTKFGTIGVLICADSFEENILNEMKTKKPDVMLIPYGWATDEKEWPKHGEELVKVVKKVAAKLNCTVIGTNLVGTISNGPWAGKTYGGLSVAYDFNKDILVKGKYRERDLTLINL